ncbi:hypothetical protein AsAng_0058060 [Aureispira anguillae]|uniref:Uncharacterized protein n=2 Tax=Aureispira anguillae TaxID=2864201 RepID=A0A916DVD3_9BACT|nr:hypothetical protein AsAng_0058060 [Aureispira anguillae]
MSQQAGAVLYIGSFYKAIIFTDMYNQEETTNSNLIKVIGLGIFMLLILLTFFFRKSDATPFGLPLDQTEQVDSLSQ